MQWSGLKSIKRHYSIILLVIITLLMIFLVIWLSDRMMMRINHHPSQVGGIQESLPGFLKCMAAIFQFFALHNPVSK